MTRIVSVWLPRWSIERLARARPGAVPRDAAFALVEGGARGLLVTAVNRAAAAQGVAPGLALADARARYPALLSRPAEPARDHDALLGLARWLGRYGPHRHIDTTLDADSPDPRLKQHALWFDCTGSAHLFGGEAALLADLVGRFKRTGITARAGLADTPGAAVALARFATDARCPAQIAPSGATADALASLPVEALRLTAPAVLLLRRLGLVRIGDLYHLPRQALAARFSEAGGRTVGGRRNAETIVHAVLHRLDQALGRADEPRVPIAIVPDVLVRHAFEPPLISHTGIEAAVRDLVAALVARLAERSEGARRLVLTLYRMDGTLMEARAGLSAPSRDDAHIGRLLLERLSTLDAGFGIDTAVLAATETVALVDRQISASIYLPDLSQHKSGTSDYTQNIRSHLTRDGDPAGSDNATHRLIDRLSNRLGAEQILRLSARASHRPEQAEVVYPALGAPTPVRVATAVAKRSGSGAVSAVGLSAISHRKRLLRPAFLLPWPERVQVIAEVPDGAPAHLVWRRHARRILRAEGPERIGPEWWRAIGMPRAGESMDGGQAHASLSLTASRDYYRLEDAAGQRLWVFRTDPGDPCDTEVAPDPASVGDDDPDTEPSAVTPGMLSPHWFIHGVFA